MDSLAALALITEALADADLGAAADAAEDLAAYLETGGTAPPVEAQEAAALYCSIGNLNNLAGAWRAADDARVLASVPVMTRTPAPATTSGPAFPAFPPSLTAADREALATFTAYHARLNPAHVTTVTDVPGCGLYIRGAIALAYGAKARKGGAALDLPCLAVCEHAGGSWSALYRHPQTTELTQRHFTADEICS